MIAGRAPIDAARPSRPVLLLALLTFLPLAILTGPGGGAPAAAPPGGRGSIRVVSDPSGARILRDGEIQGRTPAELKRLPPGRYSISLSYPGYYDHEETVRVKRGEETLLWVTLEPKPGRLTITSAPPGGLIHVDGRMKARTRWDGEVAAGTHTVKVELEGHATAGEMVFVPPDTDRTVEIMLMQGTPISIQEGPVDFVRRQDRLFEFPSETEQTGRDGAPMVLVPAGPFLMGSADEDRQADDNERPQRLVHLKAFLIDKYEVPNATYRRFLLWVDRNGHARCPEGEPAEKDHTPGTLGFSGDEWNQARQPVVEIDWYDAAAYCAWAGRRLPTEAEWEKAARGTEGRLYPWGDEKPGKLQQGNFADRSYLRRNPDWTWIFRYYDDGHAWTAPIGSFPRGASAYGVEDMAGNIAEWVADFYAEDYYKVAPNRDPPGPGKGLYRVLKGGSWNDAAWALRSAVRVRWLPGFRVNVIGFRCAADAPEGE